MTSSIHFAILSLVLICHLKYINAQFRIRGGKDINIEQTPHTVAFFHQTKYRIAYICAGSLVNMNSVVTVAHQLVNREKKQLIVLAGITYISELNTKSGQKRGVDKIHYCGYDPFTGHMDIAVVKVDAPFHKTERVKSISLCQTTFEPYLHLEISGWGSISSASFEPSNGLKTTNVPIIARPQCEYIYKIKYGRSFLAETFMCGRCTGSDPCFGDAGAAGLLEGRLCAVVQGGCERGSIPSLFTNVTNPTVYQFISSHMLSN